MAVVRRPGESYDLTGGFTLDSGRGEVRLAAATLDVDAMGRFFTLRGITPAEQRALDFRVACPVNMRADSDKAAMGNAVSMLSIQLPLGEPDPLRRFERVRERAAEAKGSRQAAAMQSLAWLSDQMFPAAFGAIARAGI